MDKSKLKWNYPCIIGALTAGYALLINWYINWLAGNETSRHLSHLLCSLCSILKKFGWCNFHNRNVRTSDMLFRVRPICSAKLLVVYVCTPNKVCDHGSFGCCRDLKRFTVCSTSSAEFCWVLLCSACGFGHLQTVHWRRKVTICDVHLALEGELAIISSRHIPNLNGVTACQNGLRTLPQLQYNISQSIKAILPILSSVSFTFIHIQIYTNTYIYIDIHALYMPITSRKVFSHNDISRDRSVPLCSFHSSKSVVPVLSNVQAWMHCSSALSQGMHLCLRQNVLEAVKSVQKISTNSKIFKSNPTLQTPAVRCKGTSLRLLSQSEDSWEQDVALVVFTCFLWFWF